MNRAQENYTVEPGQSFEIDLFRPQDAPGVANLFRTVYGEGYPIRKFIEPELLVEENAIGRTISSVARTPRGDIIGHSALYNSAPYTGIYESGAGLVLPSYRATAGIFTSLVAHGLEVAADKFEVDLVYEESVCNHIFSQKAAANLGLVTRAIEIGLMPAEAYEEEKSATGRVAATLDFKTLRPKPQTVYLPVRYEDALRFLYDGLDDRRVLLLADKDLPSGKSTITTEFFDFARVARMAVNDAGSDFESVLKQHEVIALGKGMIVIQVWLKLSWPWVGKVVEFVRNRGYSLGGILPRWFDDDGMLMQKIMGEPNWEGIHLYTDRAKKLLELVRADWQQAGDSLADPYGLTFSR